jgi:hypothetical protein
MQLENFSTWHNVPMASLANGFKGLNTELEFNNSLHVKHIQNMVLDHFEDRPQPGFECLGRTGGEPHDAGQPCGLDYVAYCQRYCHLFLGNFFNHTG